MTVKELLNNLKEIHNDIPECLMDLTTDQFVGVWEMFSDTHKSNSRDIYFACCGLKLNVQQESPLQEVSEKPNTPSASRKIVAKDNKEEKDTLSELDKNPFHLSDAAWLLARNTTINQARENGLPLEENRLLQHFQEGEATLESVLKTNREDFGKQPHVGRGLLSVLDEWQESIINVIDENSYEYNPFIAAAPTYFLVGHSCRELSLNEVIGADAQKESVLYNQQGANRLLNSLHKIGCNTIFDLFKSPLNVRQSLGVKSLTYELCDALMKDIKSSIEKYDEIAQSQLRCNEVVEDPLTVQTNGSKKTHIRESGNTLLKLTNSDGEVMKENIAWKTFYKFVVRAGIDKVRALNLSVCKVPLVSNTLDSKYAVCQKDLGGGWYLMTHGSTKDKKNLIEQIAKALDIDVKVEIVPK